MADVRLRPMTRGDLDAVNAIYNHFVRHSTCTYQLEPETAAARAAWFDDHGPAHPLLVAERGGTVVGRGSLSRYNPRGGYARTVENSVYVAHDVHRQGIGSLILGELVALARTHSHHLIVAGIDAAQEASVALHTRFDFTHAGRFSEAGFKFDRWLDVVYMQLVL